MLRQAQHFRCEHTETITESRRDVGALRHNVGAVIVTIFFSYSVFNVQSYRTFRR